MRPNIAFAQAQKASIGAVGSARFNPKSVDLTTPRGGAAAFTRANAGAPILTLATQDPAPGAVAPTTQPSMYWPVVIDARASIGAAALDEWYMYLTPDHGAGGATGVWLYTAPTPQGPWVGRGRVYNDAVNGSQTETAAVVKSPQTGLLHMYYQQQGMVGMVGQQSTCLATSTDGRNWTRVGPVLDVLPNATAGDGHTGYFRVFIVGGMWIGYSLYGGADFPRFNIWRSGDGIDWFADPNPLGHGDDLFDDGRRIEWNSVDIVWWRGRLWAIGMASNFVSGSAVKDGRLFMAPIADDLRHLLGTPQYVLHPTQGQENTNYRANYSFVDREGQLTLLYQCSSANLTDWSNIYAAVAN